jgi:Asp-tRNA(Asn)/Glu-tRNA(Gln) amidotransferase B subunit
MFAFVMKKHAYPWETKKHAYAAFYANMTNNEFLAWVRYNAIEAGASPQFIESLDRLASIPSEDEVESRIAEAEGNMCGACAKAVEITGVEIGLNDEQIRLIVTSVLAECET